MVAAIRINLADLIRVISETPTATRKITMDVAAIRSYLQNKPAGTHDLAEVLGISDGAVLRRLDRLRAAGEIVSLPDHRYQFVEHG